MDVYWILRLNIASWNVLKSFLKWDKNRNTLRQQLLLEYAGQQALGYNLVNFFSKEGHEAPPSLHDELQW